ncbi:hypothetical protein FRB93_004969 [Tulasnella sp. JGI-2019a]|nr:hypothetical protein FRB93_004969 [Tulasnella sp. JGI-2019a]
MEADDESRALPKIAIVQLDLLTSYDQAYTHGCFFDLTYNPDAESHSELFTINSVNSYPFQEAKPPLQDDELKSARRCTEVKKDPDAPALMAFCSFQFAGHDALLFRSWDLMIIEKSCIAQIKSRLAQATLG